MIYNRMNLFSYLRYRILKITALAMPNHTTAFYDFPKTYLRSRKLEIIRRKFYYYYSINQISKITRTNKKKIKMLYLECIKNCKDIISNIINLTKITPRERYGGYPAPEIFYILMRIIKPKIVVETGVSFGVTSAFTLQALDDNGYGKLYSIDLPFEFAKKEEVAMLVPERLKHRWSLILGDSKQALPKLLNELKEIDIFIHDSLHTYEHMMFEFKTAWKYIKKGGYLISDDIHLNNSFIDFCSMLKISCYQISTNLGIIKKDD